MDAYSKINGEIKPIVIGGYLPDNNYISLNDDRAQLWTRRNGILYTFPKRDKCLCNLVPFSFLKPDDAPNASLWIKKNPNLRFGSTNFNGLSTRLETPNMITLGHSDGYPNLTFWWNKGLTFFTCKSNSERMRLNNFAIYFRGNAGANATNDCTLLRMLLIKVNAIENGNIIIGSNKSGKLTIYIAKGNSVDAPHEVLYTDPTLTIKDRSDIGLSVNGKNYFVYLNGNIVKRGVMEYDLSPLESCGFGVGQKIPVNSNVNAEVRINNMTVWDEALTEDEFFEFTNFIERLTKYDTKIPNENRIMLINEDSYINKRVVESNGISFDYKPRLLDTDNPDAGEADGNLKKDLFDTIYNGTAGTTRGYSNINRCLFFPQFRPGPSTKDGNPGNGFRFKRGSEYYPLDSGTGLTILISFKVSGEIHANSSLLGLSPGDSVKSDTENLLRFNFIDKTDKMLLAAYGDKNLHEMYGSSSVYTLAKDVVNQLVIRVDETGNVRAYVIAGDTGRTGFKDIGRYKCGDFKKTGIKNLMLNFRTNWRNIITSSTGTFNLKVYDMQVFNSALDIFQIRKLQLTMFRDDVMKDPDVKLIYLDNKTFKTGIIENVNGLYPEFRPRMMINGDTNLSDGNVAVDPFAVIANTNDIRTERYLNMEEGFLFLPKNRQEWAGSGLGQNRPGFRLMFGDEFVPIDSFDEVTYSITCSYQNFDDFFVLIGLANADEENPSYRYLRLEPHNGGAVSIYGDDRSMTLPNSFITNTPVGGKFTMSVTINKNGEFYCYKDGVRIGGKYGNYNSNKFTLEGGKAIAFNEWKNAKTNPGGKWHSSDMKIYALNVYGKCLNDEEIKKLHEDMNKQYTPPPLPDPPYDSRIPMLYKITPSYLGSTSMPTINGISAEFMPRLKPVNPDKTGLASPTNLLCNGYNDEAGFAHLPLENAVRFLASTRDRRGFGFRLTKNGVFVPLDDYEAITICCSRNIVSIPNVAVLGFVTGDDGKLASYLTIENNKIVYNGGTLSPHHSAISTLGQGRYAISISSEGRVFVYFYAPSSGTLIKKECPKLNISRFKGCGIKGFVVCGYDEYFSSTPTPSGYGDVWFKGFTIDPQFLPPSVVEQRLNELNQ